MIQRSKEAEKLRPGVCEKSWEHNTLGQFKISIYKTISIL